MMSRPQMLRPQPWHRAAITGAMLGALFLATCMPPASAVETNHQPHFYLALGGSGSVGVQPTAAVPRGRPTDAGYANDLLAMERSRWTDLRLIRLGCPGATTLTMLEGGGRCAYRTGSQFAAALAFIRRHPSTVLVTLDLGFNNVRRCLAHQHVDEACVAQTVGNVRQQLSEILTSLRAAGGPGLEIVGVGHYDPYLGDYLKGPAGRAFAVHSLGVVALLNDALRSDYGAAGVPMADVPASFDTAGTEMTTLAGVGSVPADVARVCALTWMCAPAPLGPNPHANDAGYRAISQAIAAVLPAH
jgi:GDSL-like Lipase/Acylhydrolase family